MRLSQDWRHGTGVPEPAAKMPVTRKSGKTPGQKSLQTSCTQRS